MQLLSTQQLSEEHLVGDFDIFIGASGFEKRAVYAICQLGRLNIRRKIAFGFSDRKNAQRSDNDWVFERQQVQVIEADGDLGETIISAIQNTLKPIKSKRIRILVDYSSMTRSWYAAIITAIREVENREYIECYFCYSPSVFEAPHPTAPNESVSPIPGFGGLDAVDKPSALVVGLGYEKDRAVGLLEYVDPAACFAFITDPPLDSRYLHFLKRNNESFLRRVRPENQYRHPLHDLQRIGNLLLSLVWGLREQYRIILAPLGVKPFSLMCLLLATRYPELDVWRVTSGTKAGASIRAALGPLLVLRADFCDNEHFPAESGRHIVHSSRFD